MWRLYPSAPASVELGARPGHIPGQLLVGDLGVPRAQAFATSIEGSEDVTLVQLLIAEEVLVGNESGLGAAPSGQHVRHLSVHDLVEDGTEAALEIGASLLSIRSDAVEPWFILPTLHFVSIDMLQVYSGSERRVRMTKKTLLTLCSILLLTVAVGAVVAVEPVETPAEAMASPEPAITTPDLSELLAEEAPQMSIEPQKPATAEALPSDTSWHQWICYPNTCIPCTTSETCLLGDRCVNTSFCP